MATIEDKGNTSLVNKPNKKMNTYNPKNKLQKNNISNHIENPEQKETIIDNAMIELRNLKFALDQAATVSITDINGRIIYVNDKFCEVTGYCREELLNKTHRIVKSGYHPEHYYQKMWATILSGSTWKGEVLNHKKDGSNWWADVTITPFLNDNNEPYQFIAIRSDITERKNMEEVIRQKTEELQLSEARFRSLVQHSHEMISILDKNGTILYSNFSTENISGYSSDELIEKNIFDFIHPADFKEATKGYQELLLKPGETLKSVYRLKHANGSWRYYELIFTNLIHEKSIQGITGNIRDITESKKAANQIHHMAYFDHLTSLPNRRFFEKQLTEELIQAKQANLSLSVMFLDLDGFKYINDSLGHETGDKLLKAVGIRLNKAKADNKTMVFRIGGDEFTIISSDIADLAQVNQNSQQILELFKQPFLIDSYELFITTSIGVSIFPQNGNSVQELVKNADSAMYQAKEKGKNNYQVHSSTLKISNDKKFMLQNDLRKAIERDEFSLHYQPIIDLSTNKLIGAEALIRWNHPLWGIISPTEFIPLAEQRGLIGQIDEWVLNNACKQTKVWQDLGLPPIKISVNFSPMQFSHANIVEIVDKVLAQTGLEPTWLEIEITETTLLKNEALVFEKIEKLKSKGISIAIDDFGTGYASLSYLRKFNVNTLKIDKIFIKDLWLNSNSKEIVSAIIQLAKKMNITTVAEGVETLEQLAILSKNNCDIVQGFLFSKPLSRGKFEELLKEGFCLPEKIYPL